MLLLRIKQKNSTLFFLSTILFILPKITFGQIPELTDYLLTPRLDTAYWNYDYEKLNTNYSRVANQCQTCVFSENDTIRSRFCFNTSSGHIRIDTTFHNITPEKLTGEWQALTLGIFEIVDSLPANAGKFIRTKRITENSKGTGKIIFTDKVVKMDIQAGGNKQKTRKRYVILEGKYLMTKKMIGMCGPTMVAITNEGLLILDIHSFRTIAKKEGYLVIKTSINRTILKR